MTLRQNEPPLNPASIAKRAESPRELARLRPRPATLIHAILAASAIAIPERAPAKTPPREIEREGRRRGLDPGARRVLPPGVHESRPDSRQGRQQERAQRLDAAKAKRERKAAKRRAEVTS